MSFENKNNFTPYLYFLCLLIFSSLSYNLFLITGIFHFKYYIFLSLEVRFESSTSLIYICFPLYPWIFIIFITASLISLLLYQSFLALHSLCLWMIFLLAWILFFFLTGCLVIFGCWILLKLDWIAFLYIMLKLVSYEF